MSDPAETRDVSSCERLILMIRFAYFLHEKGDLPEKLDQIRWEDWDRLKKDCDVLPKEFREMMYIIEKYRRSYHEPK